MAKTHDHSSIDLAAAVVADTAAEAVAAALAAEVKTDFVVVKVLG